MQFFTDSFFEILLFLYQFTGSLGLAIIVMTLIIRSILVPLTLPSLKARKKITDIQPEVNKLKKKHGKDKKALQKAQMELYQKYNVNPLSGCIPQLVQLAVLIFLYRALISFLGHDVIDGNGINSAFLWLDLTQPDSRYILPVVAGVSQFILSLMISPGGEVRDIVPNKSKSKKIRKENKKEEDTAGMAASMQQQMLYMMPIMTVFIAAKFPSGLAVYWVMTTVFSIGQQYFISGLGGLKTYLVRAQALLNRK
ncbi:MAG: membrane protein insertase YidC [Candidatus Pacebacteria bacterium]|jgi:YidC/Oxa1 family membrane protein insertase|nr:membrane protein insertase YidC [Candidatus Paceibacterota bacterium]MBT3512120.1 membrane protein insertase YidC [Candidatus Paceibacterota bacterium]MBT4005418.1 membrane protein insertase YidC [Candidatus Paceibacterota bacterium]MBT4359127.1 membrane protein insertase YidC [Candidatus Paceibacterota bacterium]MBT4680956.1 membrane protein insertase YidC [Candidatus Paceibacterota bacterium]